MMVRNLEKTIEDLQTLIDRAQCPSRSTHPIVLTPEAEEHFKLALLAIDSAKSHMRLASYAEMKGR